MAKKLKSAKGKTKAAKPQTCKPGTACAIIEGKDWREFLDAYNRVVSRGLACGVGGGDTEEPVCIEAAVGVAFGYWDESDPQDQPKCVDEELRSFKIGLNDNFDGTELERAKLLYEIGIAQLGTNKGFNFTQFIVAVQAAGEKLFAKPEPTFDDILKEYLEQYNGLDAKDINKTVLQLIKEGKDFSFDTYDWDCAEQYLTDNVDPPTINQCGDVYTPEEYTDEELFYLFVWLAVQELIKLDTPGSRWLKAQKGERPKKLQWTKAEQKRFGIGPKGVPTIVLKAQAATKKAKGAAGKGKKR